MMKIFVCILVAFCFGWVGCGYAALPGEPCVYCYQYIRCLANGCSLTTSTGAEQCKKNAVSRKQTCATTAATYAGAGNYTTALRNRLVNNVETLIQEYINWQGSDKFIDDICKNFNGCCADCDAGCLGGGDWVDFAVGYQKKSVSTCQCGSCVETGATYRCAAGYYGSSSNGMSGCSKCPAPGTSVAGTTTKNGCYISSGTDAGGTYSYTSMCYYSN